MLSPKVLRQVDSQLGKSCIFKCRLYMESTHLVTPIHPHDLLL